MWDTVARLAPRHHFGPRPLGPWTIFFDLVVIGLGIPGWLFFIMAEYYTDPSYPTPWRDDQERAGTMVIVFWYVSHSQQDTASDEVSNGRSTRILHCVMCIMGCSACCNCCGCGPANSKQAAAAPSPVHPAQRKDLEQADNPEPLPNYKQSTGLEEIEPAAVSADPPSYPEAVRMPPHKST